MVWISRLYSRLRGLWRGHLDDFLLFRLNLGTLIARYLETRLIS